MKTVIVVTLICLCATAFAEKIPTSLLIFPPTQYDDGTLIGPAGIEHMNILQIAGRAFRTADPVSYIYWEPDDGDENPRSYRGLVPFPWTTPLSVTFQYAISTGSYTFDFSTVYVQGYELDVPGGGGGKLVTLSYLWILPPPFLAIAPMRGPSIAVPGVQRWYGLGD